MAEALHDWGSNSLRDAAQFYLKGGGDILDGDPFSVGQWYVLDFGTGQAESVLSKKLSKLKVLSAPASKNMRCVAWWNQKVQTRRLLLFYVARCNALPDVLAYRTETSSTLLLGTLM